MSSKLVIRWGILGGAWIAQERLLPAITEAKNAETLAIASRSLEKAKTLAQSFHIPRAYGSYEELLNDPDIDAVYIPLPNHLHAKWVIRAAEAGKHILCEKPAAISVKEVEDMVAACRENHVLFMEAFAFRCHPEWHRLRELLNSGQIGEIRTVQGRYSFSPATQDDIRLNLAYGGGVLFDIGSYCVSGIRFIMGDEPEEVHGVAQFDSQQVDRSIIVSMKFPGGRLAQFDCTFESDYNQYLEISGTKGIIKIRFPYRYPQIVIQKNGEQTTKVFQDSINTYVAMVEHFSSCILSGEETNCSPADSIANMKVIEAIYLSARNQ